MIAFFISVLVERPLGSNRWEPNIRGIMTTLRPDFRWIFATTTASPDFVARPFACGLIEVNATELAVLDAATDLWAFDATNWRTMTVADVPVVQRNKLMTLLSDRQSVADVRMTDTLDVAFEKVLNTMPGLVATIPELVARWNERYPPISI